MSYKGAISGIVAYVRVEGFSRTRQKWLAKLTKLLIFLLDLSLINEGKESFSGWAPGPLFDQKCFP